MGSLDPTISSAAIPAHAFFLSLSSNCLYKSHYYYYQTAELSNNSLVTRQQQKKRGRPRKFPPGVRPIRLGLLYFIVFIFWNN